MTIFKRFFGGGDGVRGDGETAEFKAFLEGSMEGLRLMTETHQGVWGFGNEERWDFADDSAELVFTFPDKIVRAPAQIIGSFDSLTNTWLWAWANSSIAEPLTKDSRRVRDYGAKNGVLRLTTRKWHAAELDGWEMTALACRLCNSNGAYRGPSGTTFFFFSFGEVQLSKRT